MELIARTPLSSLLGFFAPRSTSKEVNNLQDQNQEVQLSQMIKQQKCINDLVYVCDINDDGQLNCRWVKACSI